MFIVILSTVIILIDQLSKYLIRSNFEQFQKIFLIRDYLYLTFVKNRGAAFGILSGQHRFFILITVLFLIFIIYLYKWELSDSLSVKIALSFLFGGSLGNLIDRMLMHYVTDFIAVDLFDFYQLPVINIADIFIFFGVLILIFQLMIDEDRGV
ncbi:MULTISPECIES: signal peptidase II [Halanaerobium]|jgi:signal peptidase II|uniref:Lipoprotein signal peptidase n=1 Tax=Halanaerobium kushneri TaxID=56779 RepID=A0A1N6XAN5_9FIRM|nr:MULTISPECIES: signal peptidase II [Halanaerobium]RCW62040.1 signal peptidase II [Halanaerobium sp. ST460_2HS_T2]SIQ99311.1 signal peptidase II Aspartic peptidase. MEROPS family A08 [Halanaerobium kushneri]